MPASVNVVYNTLKDLVNKDQQGFVTVDEFNRFAQVAQLRIFNRLFDTLKHGSRLERAGFGQGRDKSKQKQIQEDLAIFAKSVDVTRDSSQNVFLRNQASIDDLSRIISISTAGSLLLGQTTRTPVEICYDEEKIERPSRRSRCATTRSHRASRLTVLRGLTTHPPSVWFLALWIHTTLHQAETSSFLSTTPWISSLRLPA